MASKKAIELSNAAGQVYRNLRDQKVQTTVKGVQYVGILCARSMNDMCVRLENGDMLIVKHTNITKV
jgi:hypothetical protein